MMKLQGIVLRTYYKQMNVFSSEYDRYMGIILLVCGAVAG